MTSFMLTAFIISCGYSHLMCLTSMMSYDVCKKMQILYAHNLTPMRKLRIPPVSTLLYAHNVIAVTLCHI